MPPTTTPNPPAAATAQQVVLCASFQIEAAEPVAGTSTTLPRFRMVAYTGGPMRLAGWRYPVVVDLAGLAIPSQNRPIRFGHDAGSGVGHTDAIRVEGGQLTATGVVSRDTAAAREVVVSSKNGFPWQASIGAAVEEFEFIKESQKTTVNGRTFEGPVNVVRKATLGEISFVDLGADGNTSASVHAVAGTTPDPSSTQKESTTMEQSTNPAPATPAAAPSTSPAPSTPPVPAPPTQPIAAAAPGAHGAAEPISVPPAAAPVILAAAAVTPPAPHLEPTVEQIRAAAAIETGRIAAIRSLCAGAHAEIEAQAIREGWDATRTELEVLRASRPKAPMVMAPAAQPPVTAEVLQAACFMSGRYEGVQQLFSEQVLEAAERRFHRSIGLQELLLEAAWANGYTGRSFRDSRTVLQFAFGQELTAGFSTIDIGGILSGVTNRFLLEGFMSVERTWRNICAVRNVSDFKAVTSYRLIGNDQYEQVAPGGELKHGNLGNETYSNKADTYGLMLSIDRRDIINDDLGAITTVPRKLGRGSGLKINDVFWTVFMNNSAFFTAGAKNYLSGAGSALGVDGLSSAEQAFLDQVDSDGKPIGVMPALLLLPTGLSALGTQLYKSLEIRDNTANTKTPINNPHSGKFRPEVSRYLGNSKYTGNSQKAWYLLADPADLPVIEVAFLNGNESPTIETAEADFSVLGIQMRGYHDFGVALQDNRGGVKSAGQ